MVMISDRPTSLPNPGTVQPRSDSGFMDESFGGYGGGGMLDPTTGESPLQDLPQWTADRTNQNQNAQFYAAQKFRQMFGRNPTASELSMLATAYHGGNNIDLNLGQGDSAIAQYFQSFTNNPANIYKRQKDQWEQQAPEHYDTVGQIFQSVYGRAPTQDELGHYGMLLSSGQADTYQLGQFLQSLPEYQNAQDTKFREGLSKELEGSDQAFFKRGKEDVISRYAQMGRPTSPALDVALVDLQAKLNENRGNFMAQLSANQYGGNKAAALKNYGDTQSDVMGRINKNPEYQYDDSKALLRRIQDISDYNTQATDYGNYLDRYGSKGPGALDYLNTAFNGINAGANLMKAGA